MNSLQIKFEKFKEITKEEQKISQLLKENIKIINETKVLEIGSNKGNISKSVQLDKSKITLIDIEEFDTDPKVKFIRDKWEEAKVSGKYDLIIASHVWGHFHHSGTMKEAFAKALSCLSKKGKLVLCYNKQEGLMKDLVTASRKIFNNFQYDYFDESLLEELKFKEIDFKVRLKAQDFEDLAELIQVLIIVPDKDFKSQKQNIVKWLKDRLNKPEFDITQKIVII